MAVAIIFPQLSHAEDTARPVFRKGTIRYVDSGVMSTQSICGGGHYSLTTEDKESYLLDFKQSDEAAIKALYTSGTITTLHGTVEHRDISYKTLCPSPELQCPIAKNETLACTWLKIDTIQ